LADEHVRSKSREVINAFALANEFDGNSRLFLHGKDESAARRSVELGQHQSRDTRLFEESLRLVQPVLSRCGIDYVENWYSEQSDTGEEIRIDDWLVQRRCPHLRADLSKAVTVENGVLTCSLHDWKFDLATGRCLTSQGHEIRASKI
jgi:hypothetical protein